MTGVSSQERVHKALSHPTRVNILLRMQETNRLSPAAYSKAAGHNVSLATYHFGRLLTFEAIELVETLPKRGATEHVSANNRQSPIVRFLLASEPPARERETEEVALASLLRGDRRQTSLSVIPVLVDPEGKMEIEVILAETKARLAAADAAARARLGEGDDQATTLHVAFTALG
jgi:hypothetical protein